jgi:hypothetical protein
MWLDGTSFAERGPGDAPARPTAVVASIAVRVRTARIQAMMLRRCIDSS